MILTTGEVGLVAVGATLCGVLMSSVLDRKRASIARRERWFDQRSEAYITFLNITQRMDDRTKSVANALLADREPDPIDDVDKYVRDARQANLALVKIRLLGSEAALQAANELTDAQIEILALHPAILTDGKPKKVSKKKLRQLDGTYSHLRQRFIEIVREELGVAQSLRDEAALPKTAIVIAGLWFRRKMYESYIRAQQREELTRNDETE
jgi:hypothetical protein